MEVHACRAQIFMAIAQYAKMLLLAFTAILLSLRMVPTALNALKVAYPAIALHAVFAILDTT